MEVPPVPLAGGFVGWSEQGWGVASCVLLDSMDPLMALRRKARVLGYSRADSLSLEGKWRRALRAAAPAC